MVIYTSMQWKGRGEGERKRKNKFGIVVDVPLTLLASDGPFVLISV